MTRSEVMLDLYKQLSNIVLSTMNLNAEAKQMILDLEHLAYDLNPSLVPKLVQARLNTEEFQEEFQRLISGYQDLMADGDLPIDTHYAFQRKLSDFKNSYKAVFFQTMKIVEDVSLVLNYQTGGLESSIMQTFQA